MSGVEVVWSVARKKDEAMTRDSQQRKSNCGGSEKNHEVPTKFGSSEIHAGGQQEYKHHRKKKDKVGTAEDGGREDQSRSSRHSHAERRRTSSDPQTKQDKKQQQKCAERKVPGLGDGEEQLGIERDRKGAIGAELWR